MLRETIICASRLCHRPRLAVVARVLSLTLTSLMLVFDLAAQSPTVRNAAVLPFDCPYRQCELTYRTGAFGGRLQVGVDARSEIGSGFTGGGIVRAMSGVPQAARIGRRAHVTVPLIPQSIAHNQFGRATDVYNRALGR
jgi:hypothetical protein